jgi:CheY-like chemotaxis protein
MTRELLLVEDSDDDYEMFLRICDTVGFKANVRRFADGDEALEYLRQLNWNKSGDDPLPALILLDLNLPGMDGRELLDVLKQDPVLRPVPVVVYTTSSNESDIAFCYEHHANGYQLKPMNVAQLESDIRALIDYWFTRVVSPRTFPIRSNG